MRKIKIIHVVQARSDIIKIAPLAWEIGKHRDKFVQKVVYAGSRFTRNMAGVFFDQLRLQGPDENLCVSSGTYAGRMSVLMTRLEDVLSKDKPDLVITSGGGSPALAATIAAAKLDISLGRIEAGLRNFDKDDPEEVVRVVADSLAHYLFTTTKGAAKNLIGEGADKKKIYCVGNTLVDALRGCEPCRDRGLFAKINLLKRGSLLPYAVFSMHKHENADDPQALEKIFNVILDIQKKIKVVFLPHPQISIRIKEFDMEKKLSKMKQVKILPPLGYAEFIMLASDAKFIISDSGALRDEANILGVPFLALRHNRARRSFDGEETSRSVENESLRISKEAERCLLHKKARIKIPRFWDGKAARRIMEVIFDPLMAHQSPGNTQAATVGKLD